MMLVLSCLYFLCNVWQSWYWWYKLFAYITDRLPYSIRILLESAIRNCDNFQVKKEDVEKILAWEINSTKQVEIPFKPARVLLQVSCWLLEPGYGEIVMLGMVDSELYVLFFWTSFLTPGFYWSAGCRWPGLHARCYE